MAWEENSRICLHMQLIAILSRTRVVYGARQYDDGEIYILCGQNQISWFDVRNIPSEIDLMTEEDLDNYDLSQENADAIISIGM